MRNVILTGFEPFDNHAVNPAQQIAERLNGEIIGGARVIGMTLPVVFGQDMERLIPAIEASEPALILSLGLNAASDAIDIEMFAINRRDTADRTALLPIREDGPAAYFATLDVERVVAAIQERIAVPVRRHGYAGSYLCNHVFYQTLHYVAARGLAVPVGFVHIPPSSTIPLDDMTTAVRAALEAALETGFLGR